ncbi:hypothetical protein BO443_30498 [Burkholderia orbicola]
MMLARCTSTVFTLIDRSDAICLLPLPSTTPRSTSFSRAVSASSRWRSSRWRWLTACRCCASRSARCTRSSICCELYGFSTKSIAPFCSARTDIGMSPCPLTKITGSVAPRAFNSVCTSKPLFSGIRTSSTRHAGRFTSKRARKSAAFANPSDAMPTDSSSHASDVRMPLSSSTMYTIGAGDVIAGVSLNIGIGVARAARNAGGWRVARVVRWGCAAHHNEPKIRCKPLHVPYERAIAVFFARGGTHLGRTFRRVGRNAIPIANRANGRPHFRDVRLGHRRRSGAAVAALRGSPLSSNQERPCLPRPISSDRRASNRPTRRRPSARRWPTSARPST